MPDAPLQIIEAPLTEASLAAYTEVPSAFRVESRLRADLINAGLSGLRFVELAEPEPWTKDYDLDEGGGPSRWLCWRSADSTLLLAFAAGQRLGSAVILTHVEGMEFLRGFRDTAALWDLRVRPERRRQGIGTQLIQAAAQWARQRGYRRLKIETQNINVPACRFYAKQGCYLGGLEQHAYVDYPDELQLIWYYDLV